MSHHNPSIVYLGLDIAKQQLALDPKRSGGLGQVANTAAGHAKILAALRTLQAAGQTPQVVLEASGGYERALVDALQAAGQRVSIVNPARVRHYAQARGLEAKTDALDAALLSDFADWQQPAPAPVLSKNQRALAELCTRRAQLLDLQTMEKNRQEHHQLPLVRQSGRTTLRQLERQLEIIEQAIWALQSKRHASPHRRRVVVSVVGGRLRRL